MSIVLENPSKEDEAPPLIARPSKYHDAVPQLFATTIVSCLDILVGYSAGYFSPAEESMIQDLNLTKSETTWISSLLPVGAVIGSLSGGPFLELLGRKKTLIITDLIFLIAWSINYVSGNYWHMYLSRILNGYGVGIASFALPVYLAETLQPAIRGRLGLFPTAFGNFGILISFISGDVFAWRELAGIGAILSVPLMMAMWMVPETPRWYISKKMEDEARISLKKLRGKYSDISNEMEELQLNQNRAGPVKYTKTHFQIFIIVLGLMFFQQFSGINAIIYYMTEIFKESGSKLDSSVCTAIVGVVNFVSTFIAAVIVDKLGRKVLLYSSSLVMSITLAILGLYFFLLQVQDIKMEFLRWLPLSCCIVYVLGFSFGLGPIPWLMMGEILPAAIRGPAASISAAFNWTCTFVITKTFPTFVELIGAYNVFWFFSVVTGFSLLFFKLFVPETKKRTLEDIERILAGN